MIDALWRIFAKLLMERRRLKRDDCNFNEKLNQRPSREPHHFTEIINADTWKKKKMIGIIMIKIIAKDQVNIQYWKFFFCFLWTKAIQLYTIVCNKIYSIGPLRWDRKKYLKITFQHTSVGPNSKIFWHCDGLMTRQWKNEIGKS